MAWLGLVVHDRKRQSNDGYDDDPASHYSWDDTVPNRDALQPGHVLALWDTKTILGVSVIEEIIKGTATKQIHRCRGCGGANFERRRKLTPVYRCYSCKAEFDDPITFDQEVRTFRSVHNVAWTDLFGILTAEQLRALCQKPRAQNSLRRLDWPRFQEALRAANAEYALTPVRTTAARIKGGHTTATVRVRVGQQKFRQALIARHGPVCAFTGSAPEAVLDAAHLYSYAKVGAHHDDGGFLLRRDLHSLFDKGLLAVEPETRCLDVAPELLGYPHYASLHGEKVTIDLTARHLKFLTEHWNTHR